jgi:beta-lactamase class A
MSGRSGGGAGNVFDPNVVVDIGRRIEREFARFEALSGGVLGISAVNLSDGRMLGYRADDAFPMASTFKVSLAMLVLQQAEVGLLDMAQMVALEADLRVPPPLIEAYFRHPGLTVSVANLLDIMLVTSDNSATDALLHLVGGPVAVMRAIEKAGIAGMRVDRSTSSFLANFLDLEVPAGQSFATVFASLPLSKKGRLYALTEQANNGYEDDPRDSTTPAAMARLLQKLWQGDLLGTTGQSTLFEIMERCENDERLKGLLPHGTKVAHKTGTLGGATSDVGIVELPYGAGTMAIAVYVKKSRAPTPQRERAIAHATRTVYDYMIFGQAEISNGSR